MKTFFPVCLLAACLMAWTGCGQTSNPADEASGPTESTDHGHDHAHDDHSAPHGGHLIELGRNHEYHAELVDDHQAATVTVYLMDGEMKPLAIGAESVSLVVTAGEETKTFELPVLDSGTEYSLQDAGLISMLDQENASGKLRVKIEDTPYTGNFDHHDHDHDH